MIVPVGGRGWDDELALSADGYHGGSRSRFRQSSLLGIFWV
jgi:hypothetical protein